MVELGTVNTVDFGLLAQTMTLLIQKNVTDPDLRDWVMPSFSTTTNTDKVVGSVLFMGAMQKYFSYNFSLDCGIPSVTLLGEIDDWKDILVRLDKIDQLGAEPARFATMLRVIVRMFCVRSSSLTRRRLWIFGTRSHTTTICLAGHPTSRAGSRPFASGMKMASY